MIKHKIRFVLIIISLVLISFLFYYVYDTFYSVDYNSKHYANVELSVRNYLNNKFGSNNIDYIFTHWNIHAFYMDKCEFYTDVKYLPSDLKFQVLSDGRNIIGDTYNQEGWKQKLNSEYGQLVNDIFGKNATCVFSFSFNIEKSSIVIDNFKNISTFNSYLDRNIEGKNEVNDRLMLKIEIDKNYDEIIDSIKITKILEALKNSGINYGDAIFDFINVSKDFTYESTN